MGRLKPAVGQALSKQGMPFTFQYGRIKTLSGEADSAGIEAFTFQYEQIKTRPITLSAMEKLNLHSNMDRLKRNTDQHSARPRAFTFQYG